MKYLNIEWVKLVRRPYPPFYFSIINGGITKKVHWKGLVDFPYAVRGIIIVGGNAFYPTDHTITFADKLSSSLFSDKTFITRLKEESLCREKALIEAVQGSYEEFVETFMHYIPTVGIFIACDRQIEEKVRGLLAEKTTPEETTELLQLLNIPQEDNFYLKERHFLATTKDIKATINRFAWIKSRYGTIIPYTEKMAAELLQELEQSHFLQHSAEQKKKVKEAVARAKQLVGKDNEHIIETMQFFVYYRTQRTDVINYAAYYFAPKLEKLAKEKGLSYNELLQCTQWEIMQGIPPKDILSQRMKAYTLIITPKIKKILSGKEHDQIAEKFLMKEERSDVKGRCAYEGTIIGAVKIIRSIHDLPKIKEGDILVTSMTTPEMVVAMKRAGGIVTDEGGITCHAAIVAREMKKPCVIGTGCATDVFKDGDRVEVDANNGIVRKVTK